MDEDAFRQSLSLAIGFKENPYHPLVWIVGEPVIGEHVYIGGMSEVNAKDARVEIGNYCDIASFVSINAADSHRMCLGLSDKIDRRDIVLEHNVFVGTGAIIKGGARIGHHTVVAAGTVVEGVSIPPFSLVVGNPMTVKPGYYAEQLSAHQEDRPDSR